jgi:hypothetical protein
MESEMKDEDFAYEQLRQKRIDNMKQIVALRDALETLWVGTNRNEWDEKAAEFFDKTLATTQDLSGLVLCDAEPVAWFHVADDGTFVTQGNLLAGGEPLYKARKQP